MRGLIFSVASAVLLSLSLPAAAVAAEQARYTGAEACKDCHEEQYESFMANSSKAHSWKSLEKMLSKLTGEEKRQCYVCHTTGYGKPGGFESLEKTPHLANVSCEACHGPGSAHVESGEAADIRRTPHITECVVCHNEERVRNFNFKPMLYHGGH